MKSDTKRRSRKWTDMSLVFQICTFLKGSSIQWIDDQKVPYATKNSEWVGFDTKESYETKVGAVHVYMILAQANISSKLSTSSSLFILNRCATFRIRSMVELSCGLWTWMILQGVSVVRGATRC